MASSLFPQASPPQNNGADLLKSIQGFAGTIKGKDPQKMVYALMQQRGIGRDRLEQVMEQAKSIAKLMK